MLQSRLVFHLHFERRQLRLAGSTATPSLYLHSSLLKGSMIRGIYQNSAEKCLSLIFFTPMNSLILPSLKKIVPLKPLGMRYIEWTGLPRGQGRGRVRPVSCLLWMETRVFSQLVAFANQAVFKIAYNINPNFAIFCRIYLYSARPDGIHPFLAIENATVSSPGATGQAYPAPRPPGLPISPWQHHFTHYSKLSPL